MTYNTAASGVPSVNKDGEFNKAKSGELMLPADSETEKTAVLYTRGTNLDKVVLLILQKIFNPLPER